MVVRKPTTIKSTFLWGKG